MIKEDYVIINGHSSNYIFYREMGYDVQVRKPFSIKTKDLMRGSTVKITTICDKCSKESVNVFKDYWNYTNGLKEDFYCTTCNRERAKLTCIEKYGVENPMQSEEVKDKLKSTLLEKYGVDHYSKTQEWLNKFKLKSTIKWGDDNPSKNETIKEKIRNSNLAHLNSDKLKQITKEKKQRVTWRTYNSLLSDDYNILQYNDGLFTIHHSKCNREFEITRKMLSSRNRYNSIICTKCNEICIQKSSIELEICQFLDTINIVYETRNRKILSGLEIDIFIPSFNLAIEVNGIYWHSEWFKPVKYHLNKTLRCNENGIQLIHIWEDDWKLKKEIIKSIIANRLNLSELKIYARKCKLVDISSSDARKFLNDNHIQSYSSSTIKLGLTYNNELVSLMTFGWRRTNNKREYELIRFCNKKNVNIVGGASKLFKHFLSMNLTNEIVSYADISMFNGGLYKELGFINNGLSKPNYFWVVDGVRKHRYNFSKRKLVKKGYDANKTEVEIMHDLGYWRVYSTGQERWVYNLN